MAHARRFVVLQTVGCELCKLLWWSCRFGGRCFTSLPFPLPGPPPACPCRYANESAVLACSSAYFGVREGSVLAGECEGLVRHKMR